MLTNMDASYLTLWYGNHHVQYVGGNQFDDGSAWSCVLSHFGVLLGDDAIEWSVDIAITQILSGNVLSRNSLLELALCLHPFDFWQTSLVVELLHTFVGIGGLIASGASHVIGVSHGGRIDGSDELTTTHSVAHLHSQLLDGSHLRETQHGTILLLYRTRIVEVAIGLRVVGCRRTIGSGKSAFAHQHFFHLDSLRLIGSFVFLAAAHQE